MIEQFRSGELDEVYVIYTRMVNAMQVETDTVKLLPLHKADFRSEGNIERTCRCLSGRYGVLSIHTQCDGKYCAELY